MKVKVKTKKKLMKEKAVFKLIQAKEEIDKAEDKVGQAVELLSPRENKREEVPEWDAPVKKKKALTRYDLKNYFKHF